MAATRLLLSLCVPHPFHRSPPHLTRQPASFRTALLTLSCNCSAPLAAAATVVGWLWHTAATATAEEASLMGAQQQQQTAAGARLREVCSC